MNQHLHDPFVWAFISMFTLVGACSVVGSGKIGRHPALGWIIVTILFLGRFILPLNFVVQPRVDLMGFNLIIGIPLFILSGIMVHTHIGKGKLCTTGVYAYCRHPLYAAWVLFVVPGIVMIIGSVVAISWPIFLYVLCKIYTAEEEEYLRVKFGDEYLSYEKEVYAIFPKIWRKYS